MQNNMFPKTTRKRPAQRNLIRLNSLKSILLSNKKGDMNKNKH